MKSSFRRGGHGRPLAKGLLILPLFFMLPAVGCSRTASKVSATVTDKQISPKPARVGPVTIRFSLNDAAKAVSGAQVSLEGDMTHAGMAPVFGDAHEVTPGQYQGQLNLNMAGDWVVLLHITLPNGRKLEDQIDIRGVLSS